MHYARLLFVLRNDTTINLAISNHQAPLVALFCIIVNSTKHYENQEEKNYPSPGVLSHSVLNLKWLLGGGILA